MEKLTIKKTPKGKEFLYEVFNEAGQKIGQRKSPREYVAAAVYVPGSKYPSYDYENRDAHGRPTAIIATRETYDVASWIGRLDLVGKNQDVARNGARVAYLVTI